MSKRVSQLEIFLTGFRDDSDNPANGYIVKFFTADQTYTTPKNAWTTKDKDATITSVTLDPNGRYTTGAYFAGGEVYDLRLYESDGTTVVRSYANVKVPETTTSIRTVTAASDTATIDDDVILCDTTSNAITINLYAVADAIKGLTIKNIGSASNDVTVDGNGAELIDGSATATVTDSQATTYYSDGTQWRGAGASTGSLFTTTSLLFGDGLTSSEAAGVTTASVDGVVESGSSAELKVKVLNIGDWDMDATATVDVSHGLGDASIIRSVSVMIVNDTDTSVKPLYATQGSVNDGVDGGVFNITNFVVSLTRITGGQFDGTGYDSTSYNRGWVTIWYDAS